MSFDQPDNAARLRKLGVARVVPAGQFTTESLTAALRELFADPAVAVACAEAKRKLESSDPLIEACDWIEQLRGMDAVSQ